MGSWINNHCCMLLLCHDQPTNLLGFDLLRGCVFSIKADCLYRGSVILQLHEEIRQRCGGDGRPYVSISDSARKVNPVRDRWVCGRRRHSGWSSSWKLESWKKYFSFIFSKEAGGILKISSFHVTICSWPFLKFILSTFNTFNFTILICI